MDTIIEELLVPDLFDVDPKSHTAEKQYLHWRRIFSYFIEDTITGSATPAQNVSQDKFKLRCLTKYVSYSVYEYIADYETFYEAIAVLDNIFIKTKNGIFHRHLLATRQQKPKESIEEYIQELNSLSKNIKPKPVTAEEYRQDLVRD